MSDIYCALCGVQVEVHDGDTAEDSKLRWNATIRAIRARAYVHEPYVTGVGYLNAHRQVCADANENTSYKDPAAQLTVNDLHNTGFQQYWCYALHDFCWKLLRHIVDPEGKFSTKTIACQLFAVLYNTPANLSGGLLPGHDYEGALKFRFPTYTSPPLLSQRFWASRFNDDAEMAFAFALREDRLPPEPIDWRQLYQKARSMLRYFQTYPGFMNRRRIWQFLLPGKRLFKRNPRVYAIHDPQLAAGSRLFEKQYLGFPQAPGPILRLGVSFISTASKQYICGLRVLTKESGGYVEYSRAGFIDPLHEGAVDLGSPDGIDGISVHVTISGIIGILFQMRRMGLPEFHVAGVLGGHADGVDKGTSGLTVGKGLQDDDFVLGLQDFGLVLGLDACKIVSLELFGSQPATESLSSTEATRVAPVWTPNSPECPVEWQHDYAATQQTFNLCTNMDFVFLGMSFVYADGSERSYGRKFYTLRNGTKLHCIVQSFSIAGPEGERICQADTAYSPSHDTIQSISLSTTANRSIAFGLHGEHLPKDKLFHTNRRAPPGKVFTSFFSRHSSPSGHFRDFSVLETPADDKANENLSMGDIALCKNPWDTIIASMLYSAKELLAHSGGFAFTSASLSGLRRIRFSVGNAGYSRESHHISGLRLEYEGSASPVVVGQWISEYQSLDIGEDERLLEIITFHHANNRFNRVKFGPLSGISIITSKGAAMEVIHEPAEGDVRLTFRETPYERLDAVAWGCNYQWDHVRVMSRYQADVAAPRELLFGPLNRQVPEWAVRDLVFLQEKTADGAIDPVESIQMTFKCMTSEPAALSFILRSGRVLSLGVPGEKPVTETLNEGEQLSRMDIGILRNNRVTSIQFKTDQKRALMFTYPSSHRLKVQRWEVHILQHNVHNEEKDHEELEGVHRIPDAASCVVGFWAIPRRLDRTLQFPSFGPIFEQEQLAGAATDENDKNT
ncbi:hypothetical protein PG996_003558 [Apiospora saccharicola]|uniref:DUF7600 domain-containing protein n=1 Tax=Apiospora saccharicola TaxID=335842 RepID=A0ABR1W5G2_9PEZI